MLISCSGSRKNNGKKIIRYNASNGITSLDPAFASNQDNIWAVSQLFEGLVTLDSTLRPVPAMARDWVISDSGRTYIFQLRKKIFFHDHPIFGNKKRPVTADDFVYSLNRIRDRSTASPGAWIFGHVLQDKDPFEAPDDRTLIIRLKEPYSPLLSILAMPYCSVVPREAVARYGKDFGRNPIGSGPFRLFYWEDNVKMILHRNTSYYESRAGHPVPAVDALSVSFIRSRESAFMEFLQGKLDFVGEIDPAFRSEMLTKNGSLVDKYSDKFDLHRSDFLNTEYLAIFQETDGSSPLSNRRFREALNLAIDKQKMIRYLRNGIGDPAAHSFVPPSLPGSTRGAFGYDPARARALLDSMDPAVREREITLTTTKDYEDLCIFLQHQWAGFGVNCKVNVVPASHLKDAKRNGMLAFFRASWIADFADAENYLSCFVSTNFAPDGPNYTHFNSPAYDSLYYRALAATDEYERLALYRRMDRMIMDSSVIIPLYYDESVWLTRNLSEVQTSPLNIPKFKYFTIR